MNERDPSLGSNPALQELHDTTVEDRAFVRALLSINDDCIKVLDLTGRLLVMSAGGIFSFWSTGGCTRTTSTSS